MTPQRTEKTRRQKITLSVVTGLISGIARAIMAKVLDHLISN
jgi:uncharacterized membrane protein